MPSHPLASICALAGFAFSAQTALAEFDFEGIVDLGNCSGSLVRFDDSLPTDRALVLTNGHCVRMIRPGTALAEWPSFRTFTLFNSDKRRVARLATRRMLYATMTKTDAALYEMQDTYQAIAERHGIQPLELARTGPDVGTEIEILSGRWERAYSCSIEAEVHALREGGWTTLQSLRYSRPGCEVVGGTSGSPVLEAGTRTVVAINNTGNMNGWRCEQNNPCEVDSEGNVTFRKGFNYAQQTFWFYSCRDENGRLDFQLPGCELPRP